MKEHEKHHERHHRAEGGNTGGVDDAGKDVDDKPEMRVNAKKIHAEAMERKDGGKAEKHEKIRHHEECKCKRCMGGRAARRRGGMVGHKEGFGPENEGTKELAHKHGGKAEHKEVGKVEGEHAKHRADRKPRMSGGRTGADGHPFSSARHGTSPPGRKVAAATEG